MNERIKELADEAADGMLSYDAEGEWRLSEREVKKFAELIVRECCDVFVELRTRPADLAVKDVKKHFGVES